LQATDDAPKHGAGGLSIRELSAASAEKRHFLRNMTGSGSLAILDRLIEVCLFEFKADSSRKEKRMKRKCRIILTAGKPHALVPTSKRPTP
jgi:hypothetical protein